MTTIAYQFKDLVEKIYDMPLEDKLELKSLLEHNISEARRNEIATNHKKAQEEHKSGRLKFSSKVNELKKML
ncbi:MAG: hypothetical protein AAB347_04010 [Bacteroidota bacterium]